MHSGPSHQTNVPLVSLVWRVWDRWTCSSSLRVRIRLAICLPMRSSSVLLHASMVRIRLATTAFLCDHHGSAVTSLLVRLCALCMRKGLERLMQKVGGMLRGILPLICMPTPSTACHGKSTPALRAAVGTG